jgi:hypothetical protein
MKHPKRFIIFIFLLGTVLSSRAQTFSINGKVTDLSNGIALVKATVYINNSTKGTVTDENGFFILPGLSAGTYELIVSFVGYKPHITTIQINSSDYTADFKLETKQKELREVLIISNATRENYMQLLKQNLIGFTYDAGKCVIRNPEVIEFVKGKYKNDIMAVADQELEIENPVLGYTIYFKMMDVFFNTKSNESHFFGYARFVDLMGQSGINKKWLRNRRNVYMGSSQHFIRSLARKELHKEGFLISIDEGNINTKKESNITIQSIGEYPSVINTDISNAAMIRTLNEDSILIKHDLDGYVFYEMKLEKKLYIKYRRNSDLKLQITRALHLKTEGEIGTVTALRLRKTPVLIDNRAVLITPANVFFDGFWAYERLANMLPEDYVPEK